MIRRRRGAWIKARADVSRLVGAMPSRQVPIVRIITAAHGPCPVFADQPSQCRDGEIAQGTIPGTSKHYCLEMLTQDGSRHF